MDGGDRDKRVAKENIKVAIVVNTSICHVDQLTAKLMANLFRDIKLFSFYFFGIEAREQNNRQKVHVKISLEKLFLFPFPNFNFFHFSISFYSPRRIGEKLRMAQKLLKTEFH